MLAVSQAIDALWHSLCPSFPSIRPALASPAFTLGWKNLKRRPPTARRPIQRISIQSYLTQRENFITPQTAIPKDWRHHLIDAEKTPGRGDLGGNGTNKATASLSQLYEDLRQESYNGEFTGVQELVRTLVIERGEKPNVRLYIALIVANISPRYGSPERVERLLQEMVDEGIQHDSNVFHAVLKVNCANLYLGSCADHPQGSCHTSRLPSPRGDPRRAPPTLAQPNKRRLARRGCRPRPRSAGRESYGQTRRDAKDWPRDPILALRHLRL